jgi:hypothetical protein
LAWGYNPIVQKIILFRNLSVEAECRGGQGSARAVALTGRQAGSLIIQKQNKTKVWTRQIVFNGTAHSDQRKWSSNVQLIYMYK